jgi:hypothetical protein
LLLYKGALVKRATKIASRPVEGREAGHWIA